MATLEKAIAIAARAHAGQVDKAGQPYILHPIPVMLRMSSEAERITGVLHDVIEDSDVTLDDLRDEGFDAAILEALDALTKRPGESRMDAAGRARLVPLARVVKLADNAENSDLSRIANPTEKDVRCVEEYARIRAFLLEEIDPCES